ncbi:MAG: hypothetical protein CM15mP117_22760 [Alphaproteobacteria bacterium]|nr:MAG: hypothetical protein CM15mP117_22760 [Alphaproteobacteria bacterium]
MDNNKKIVSIKQTIFLLIKMLTSGTTVKRVKEYVSKYSDYELHL